MGVTSGSVVSRTLKNSYFYVNWQQTGQSTDGNYTTINWQAGIVCGTDRWYSNAVKIYSIWINGTQVHWGETFSNISGTMQLASGSATIYHDGNGNKSFGISIGGWLYSYGDTSGESSFTLNSIPRHPVLSLQSVENIGLDSCLVRYKHTSGQFYHLQYRLNNGAWINIGGNPTFTLTGLTPNTSYSIQVRGMNQDKSLIGNASNSLSFKTKDIAHASVNSNIVYFPQPIKLNITNQANASVSALVFLNDEKLKEITLLTGENTINFTEEEQTEIYKKFVSNKVTIKIIVKTNNKYEDAAITKEINFNGDRPTIYVTELKKKGQLWKRNKETGKYEKAIIWVNTNKGGNPIWKKAI